MCVRQAVAIWVALVPHASRLHSGSGEGGGRGVDKETQVGRQTVFVTAGVVYSPNIQPGGRAQVFSGGNRHSYGYHWGFQ